MLLRRQFTGLRNIIWSLLGNIAQGFQLRDFVPKELRQHSKEFFRVQCCLEPFGQHCKTYLSVQSVQCCPMKMQTTSKRIFLVQCCLKSQGQHNMGFFLCNFVPRVLKQECTVFFPVAILSGASWVKLHKVFACGMLSQEY